MLGHSCCVVKPERRSKEDLEVGQLAFEMATFFGRDRAFFLVVVACWIHPSSAERMSEDPPWATKEVREGTAEAFREASIVFKIMLPFHLGYNPITRKCRDFNSRIVLQYVEASRLAADLLQNSSLLGNMSVGYQVMDSCSNTVHVVEWLKNRLDWRHVEIPRTFCQLEHCHTDREPVEVHPAQSKRWRRVYRAPRVLIGISTADILKSAQVIFHRFKMPVVSHSATEHFVQEIADSQLFKGQIFRVAPDDRFQIQAMLDLMSFFKWTHIGVFTPRNNAATELFALLRQETSKKGSLTCFGVQASYSPNLDNEETANDAANTLSHVPLVSAVVVLGNLRESLPFIRAVSRLGIIDRLAWVMTTAWGKEAWYLSATDPAYRIVAGMKSVFFFQPVPGGENSIVGVPWQTIANDLQERLRNASHWPQENNPWFEAAWNATLDDVCNRKMDVQRTDVASSTSRQIHRHRV